ncbi:MAG: hypothetical protein SO060_02620 [Oscillospiraceae bacterium]|nr:hypothetical protein [Oscillospiraceae bacterium]
MKRFEALTKPTGETSLCNPSIFLAGAYTNCKSQLVMPAQKIQKEVRPSQERAFFFYRQLQFYHRARNDKIKIDGDAIYGYTVIASLNDI